MKSLPIYAVALIALMSATPSYAMNEAECTAQFATHDKNTDGTLGQEEAMLFEERMHKEQLKPKDAGIITKDEFMKHCQEGIFDGMTN